MTDELQAVNNAEVCELLPAVPTRVQIEHLEDAIAAAILAGRRPMLRCRTVHYFFRDEATGMPMYAREITIPSGGLLTGKAHREPHVNVLSQGCIRVWTEDGMKTLTAPFSFVSRPGTKRVGLASEETVWTTFHVNPTGREDPEEMERLLVEPPRPEIQAVIDQLEERTCLSR